jgi:hypothetical protein
MIKIIAAQNIPSSIVMSGVTLCNAFNQSGHECIFYGLDNWRIDKCKTKPLTKFKIRKSDIIIVLGLPITSYDDFFCLNAKVRNLYVTKKKKLSRILQLKIRKFYNHLRGLYRRKFQNVKFIFSTSEIGDFDLSKISSFYDKIHLTNSELLDSDIKNYFICPAIQNEELKIIPKQKSQKIAGVIGEICRYKGIASSINEALKDGAKEVIIYGFMQDPVYFYQEIEPIAKKHDGKIKLAGFVQNYQEIFDSVSDVYFYPTTKIATNLPKYCQIASVNFHGNQNVISMQYLNNNSIMDNWTKELGLKHGK